jgi:hypothetical protein
VESKIIQRNAKRDQFKRFLVDTTNSKRQGEKQRQMTKESWFLKISLLIWDTWKLTFLAKETVRGWVMKYDLDYNMLILRCM